MPDRMPDATVALPEEVLPDGVVEEAAQSQLESDVLVEGRDTEPADEPGPADELEPAAAEALDAGPESDAEAPDTDAPGEAASVAKPARTYRRWVRWFAFPAILLIGAGLGYFGYQATLPGPTGHASALLYPIVANPYSPSSANLQNMQTEARLATSDKVSGAAAKALGDESAAKALLARTSAEALTGSQVIEITHRASSEEAARAGAEAFAKSFLAQRQVRAKVYLNQRTTDLKAAIDKARKSMTAAAKAIVKAKPATVARQQAHQELTVASQTLAARTDELSALSVTNTDPGQVVAVDAGTPVGRPWLWVLGGLIAAAAVVAVLHLLGADRAPRRPSEDTVSD